MREHAAYRLAYRAIALGRKTYAYYRAHGVVPTVRRMARGISSRLEHALEPRWRFGDGLAPLVISTAGEGLAALAPLPPGATLTQEISIPLECVYELEVFFPVDGPGPSGFIVLAGENGSRLHCERLQPHRRDSHGRYLLRLKRDVSIPAGAGSLRIVIQAGDGARPGASPLINPAANIGTLQVRHGRSQEVEQVQGGLALRVMARSSRALMRYHRSPVPAELASPAGAGRTLFVIGDGMPQLQSAEGGPMAVRRVDVQACLASRVYPGRDALLLVDLLGIDAARDVVKFAQSRYLPVITAIERPGPDAPDGKGLPAWRQLVAWSDVVLVRHGEELPETEGRPPILRFEGPTLVSAAIDRWLPEYRKRILPRVSIVTVLYGKARQLEAVLESYFRQTYAGELEIIFVDDKSSDDPIGLVEDLFDRAQKSGSFERLPTFKVVRNERNVGNCVSRNVGISHASGDLIVVIDADCMLCREFVERHAEAHSYGDCEIVIGPQNIETLYREPLEYLAELEGNAQLVFSQARPQDAVNPLSFLNCITRNFSVRRDFIQGDLFDPQFSYSADPASGFGWEDVEMGYRLYRRGARIKHVGDAFSVHVSHAASVPEAEKPIRSLRNFRRLLDKHPDMVLEARRWVASTYDSIKAWCDRHGHLENDDMRRMERILGAHASPVPAAVARMRRPLRILSYRWHVPHQYELYKLPHEFTLLSDLDSPMTNQWEFRHRPLPDNVRFRSRRNLRFGDFDLAILHFDENVLSYENTNGVLGPEWGAAFRWFVNNVELPRVAICHGTPQFRGQYDFDYGGQDLMQVIEPTREKLVEYLGDVLVVCNSYQAQREWKFRKSRVVWHGFDPTEFPPASYERGILSPLGPLVMSRPHYRGYFLYRDVFEGFPEAFAPSTLHVPDPSPLYEGNQYAIWKYRNYIDEIRRYSVYFNPTLRSPMPRARGEPMMCGVVTVSAKNHDVDMFIRNGVNGFYSNDAEELREQLLFLCRNPAAVRRIGAEARRTAAHVFNHDRYLGEWQEILRSLA